MTTEIFRFVTIRPPQEIVGDQQPPTIGLDLTRSAFVDQLRRIRADGGRGEMIRVAEQFVASPAFVGRLSLLDPKLAAFVQALQPLGDTGFWAAALAAFEQNIGGTPQEYLDGQIFRDSYTRVAESIIAAAIDPSVAARVRAMLVRIARALWLIRMMAAKNSITRTAFASAAVVMPGGIFPLPAEDPSLKEQRQQQARAYQEALANRRKRMAELAADLAAQRGAVDELTTAFQRTGAAAAPNPRTTRIAGDGAAANVSGFVLSDEGAKSLSAATLGALAKTGLPVTSIDVPKTIAILERRAAAIAKELYANPGPSEYMVRVGSILVPNDALLGGYVGVFNPGPADDRTPGPCPPAPDTTIPDSEPTVPTGHGDARVLGIADLLMVEQTLARYQLGEIAHIENVLASEVRSRTFRTKDSTQVTTTTETETTETKERDLSTDQRFQLQTESQTVINENASKQAGITIHASYGPSVDATANYSTSSSNSSQESHQASSSYAQEITNKAIDRIQTRTLTRRVVTTIHETLETNRHSFDNKSGTSDIVGVYRFVDKIYSAQVVNYGKRLMLEFIVPEPAAFLRYAMSSRPIDGVTLTKPDPPGYCLNDGQTFQALQASDITPDWYMYWASKYGAPDVTPPPPSTMIASGVKKAEGQMPLSSDNYFLGSDTFDIAIPGGYLPQNAFVNLYGETQKGVDQQGNEIHKLVFQLQDKQGVYQEPWEDQNLFELHLQPTSTLSVTINSIAFYNYEALVTVFCTLSKEKYEDWQLKTFNSIMNAYNDQKSAYDQAVQQARLQAADTTASFGSNPEINLTTAQRELKKGCIMLLTAQRFDLFDAVGRNIAPYGYPEIDFAEAKAEGDYIAAFEQSFEWNNMVYLFYPYFWGKKDIWPALVQISDPDPAFQQFLQAGAARVQVPVRPGFEAGVLTYLSTGQPWWAEGTVLNSNDDGQPDDPYLSIITELKSQNGNNNVDGPGTVSVTHNSAEVTGNGTDFSKNDQNRRIIIGGATYVIKTATPPDAVTLTTPYSGDTAEGLGYALGGVLVGQPWDVKVPTDFVKLDNSLVFS